MSKYIITAFDNKDKEIAIDLNKVTTTDPMIAKCERNGVEGVALVGSGLVKDTKYAFFVPLDVFIEFMLWKLLHDEWRVGALATQTLAREKVTLLDWDGSRLHNLWTN